MSYNDEEMNLLEETLEKLQSNGRTPDDVRWVGDGVQWCLWPVFVEAAGDYYYDAGCGGQNVNPNLKVVGEDWWLERHEYDGTEWWEYKSMPTHPLGEEQAFKCPNLGRDY